jgi:thiol-disulfide isomerase/thioredoxin
MEVVFYKLNGCQACEAAKPLFEKLKEQYKEFTFTEAALPKDKIELYIAHAELEPAKEYLKDDKGEVLKNHSGRPFSKVLKDENGENIMEPVYAAPSFYFINPEDEEFLGKTNNPVELESLLEQMRGLLNEQD